MNRLVNIHRYYPINTFLYELCFSLFSTIFIALVYVQYLTFNMLSRVSITLPVFLTLSYINTCRSFKRTKNNTINDHFE